VPMSLTPVSSSLIPTLRAVSPSGTLPDHVTLTIIGAEHLVNFSTDESDEDDYGHGTHVAGTIGSRMFDLNPMHNKILMSPPGTFGVAKKTQIYSVKVLDSTGRGSSSSIIAGIDFVARDAANRTCPRGAVVNISLGGRKDTAMDQAVCEMPSCS
jgi:subtilisin family serine protease